PRRGGGDGGGSNPWSSSMPDFSITTWGCAPAETARAVLGCGGVGVGTAIARGGAGVSDVARASSACATGVFRCLGVSSFSARSDFPAFFVLSDVFFPLDFLFAVLGFGVGVR